MSSLIHSSCPSNPFSHEFHLFFIYSISLSLSSTPFSSASCSRDRRRGDAPGHDAGAGRQRRGDADTTWSARPTEDGSCRTRRPGLWGTSAARKQLGGTEDALATPARLSLDSSLSRTALGRRSYRTRWPSFVDCPLIRF